MARKRKNPFTGKDGLPSDRWWRGFVRRRTLALRNPENFGKARTSFDAETMNKFYDNLLETMTNNKYDYNFFESPHRIYNCDETGMQYDQISKLIVTSRGKQIISQLRND